MRFAADDKTVLTRSQASISNGLRDIQRQM